jgi:hypothetical protein
MGGTDRRKGPDGTRASAGTIVEYKPVLLKHKFTMVSKIARVVFSTVL